MGEYCTDCYPLVMQTRLLRMDGVLLPNTGGPNSIGVLTAIGVYRGGRVRAFHEHRGFLAYSAAGLRRKLSRKTEVYLTGVSRQT